MICSRLTAFTFATCHHALSCVSALTRSTRTRSFLFARGRHADAHALDRLRGRQQRLALGLLRDGLLDPAPRSSGRARPSRPEPTPEPRRPRPLRPSRRRASGSGRPARRAPRACPARRHAVLEDDDQVGAADRREPVGDDERRPAGEEPAQRPLDAPLGADVDARGRLVEDEDARVGEQRPGEGDELALAEREPAAALGDLRLVAVLELEDEVVGADRAGRGGDFLVRRVGAAERDVLAHGAGEEEALLRDDAELPAEALLRDVAEVVAVDRDPALARVVEAREELRDRRLARAGVADERDRRPGGHVEVDAVQDLRPVAVAEAHVLEARRRRRSRAGGRAPGLSTTSGSSSITSMILSSAAVAERNVL